MKYFIAVLICLLSFHETYSQQVSVKTSIASGIHNYAFNEAITDSTTITAHITDPFTIGEFEFRVYDHNFNLLKRKPYKLYSDSLALLCGTSPEARTSLHTNRINMHPIASDSSIYVSSNVTQNYGSCSQLNHGFLFKLDHNLDTLWHRQYSMFINSSELVNDSMLLFCGSISLMMVKIQNGDTLWARKVEGNPMKAVKNFNDSTVVVFGDRSISFSGLYKQGICAYELSSSGNVIWNKFYIDTITNQRIIDVIRTSDSCFTILSLRDPNGQTSHMGLIKIDRWGNKIWEKVYKTIGHFDLPTKIIQMDNGGYLITHYSHLTLTTDFNCLLKTDFYGNVIWSQRFAGTSYVCQYTFLYKILPIKNDHYLITGGNLVETDSSGIGCFFTAHAGVIQFTGISIDTLLPVTLTSIPSNWNWKYNIKANKFIPLIRIENDFLDSCYAVTGYSVADNKGHLIAFPNPSFGKINLEIPTNFQDGILEVIDTYGKLVYSRTSLGKSEELLLDKVSAGLYIIKVSGEHGTIFKKVLIN